MCDYKVLHHNESGYALRCEHCGCIQLAFGTTVLALTIDEFYAFKESISGSFETCDAMCCRKQKTIYIPTRENAITLIYTPEELEKLDELLNQSSLALEIEKLFATDEE